MRGGTEVADGATSRGGSRPRALGEAEERAERMLIGLLALVAGLALVVWGAELFTDGAIRVAARLAMSTFLVGAVVSGFEPENLAGGAAAALGDLPQIALGTVIGSMIFLLTAALWRKHLPQLSQGISYQGLRLPQPVPRPVDCMGLGIATSGGPDDVDLVVRPLHGGVGVDQMLLQVRLK